MSATKLNTITDRCLLTGRTFAHEAEGMAQTGKVSPLDPRVIFRNETSTKQVPKNLNEIRKDWAAFLNGFKIPAPATASMLLAESILRRGDAHSVQRDLATCMESAALHIHDADPGNDQLPKYVGMASRLCDGVVLSLRHAQEKESVSAISQVERIPPQRVLAGMMRMGLVEHSDFRVSAFIEGDLGEVNAMSRKEYFDHANKTISKGMKSLNRASISENGKLEIASAIQTLARSNTHNGNPADKEISVLNANAKLAEHIGISLQKPEQEILKKQLAGVSMSSSARAISLLEEENLKKSILLSKNMKQDNER